MVLHQYLKFCLHRSLRNIDDSEKEILEQLQVPCFSMRDVGRLDISEVVDRTLEKSIQVWNVSFI
ncbi:MAG: hypothetical protein ABI045_05705 [Flavobacteriales bacterium]